MTRRQLVESIIDQIEDEQSAGSLARVTAHYWPTIKAALLEYGGIPAPPRTTPPEAG